MHSSPNVISLQQQPWDACMLYHIHLSLPNAFSARTSCEFYSLFFPLHISASLFFPSIFFPSFFFINYRRSHFSFGSLCAWIFFEWNILEKYKALNYFRNFFSQLNQSTFHFLKHRSLCLWSYILMTRSSDLQTRAIFFFSSFPPPTLFGCRICEVEKNGFHC